MITDKLRQSIIDYRYATVSHMPTQVVDARETAVSNLITQAKKEGVNVKESLREVKEIRQSYISVIAGGMSQR